MQRTCGVFLTAILAAPALAAAPRLDQARTDRVFVETCLEAASNVRPGDYVKLEFLDPSAEGMPSYEIEIRDTNGREWELMCDATTGTIYEIEQEVESDDDPLFARHRGIDEQDARARALVLYPGEITEIEYEIEANGDATYEFDIIDTDGMEMKIEVDGQNGDIIEVAVEKWQIGQEPDEMTGAAPGSHGANVN